MPFVQEAWGPSTAVEANISPHFQRRLKESHSNLQLSKAIQ